MWRWKCSYGCKSSSWAAFPLSWHRYYCHTTQLERWEQSSEAHVLHMLCVVACRQVLLVWTFPIVADWNYVFLTEPVDHNFRKDWRGCISSARASYNVNSEAWLLSACLWYDAWCHVHSHFVLSKSGSWLARCGFRKHIPIVWKRSTFTTSWCERKVAKPIYCCSIKNAHCKLFQ